MYFLIGQITGLNKTEKSFITGVFWGCFSFPIKSNPHTKLLFVRKMKIT